MRCAINLVYVHSDACVLVFIATCMPCNCMKKFKHSNADLEMARIQTEKEKARAQSADARNDDGAAGNDDGAGVDSDQYAERTGRRRRTRGIDKRGGRKSRNYDDRHSDNGTGDDNDDYHLRRSSSRPGHIKNISDRSRTDRTARYEK